ncbi:MAG: PDZ domain-containing protein, partial [Verrucomicrobiia bacterium]
MRGWREAGAAWVVGMLLAGCWPTGHGEVAEESRSEAKPEKEAEAEPSNRSVVRVNVTSQVYDFSRPWLKRAPFSRSALGVVLEEGQVLVTAELVANHNVIELEMAETGQKASAQLVAIDYQSNLAVVESKDREFVSGLVPVRVTTTGKPGDRIQIWQLESNGLLVTTDGTITTVTLDRYPDEMSYLMTYRVAASLQYRDSSFVVPVMLNGALAGLLTRYDAKTQSGQAVPGPIIEAFLARKASLPEPIFPHVAFSHAMMRDPELRAHVGLPEGRAGVFVTKVLGGSWAEEAGLRHGDVLMSIDGLEIDQDGSYTDPVHGKLDLEHLVSGGAEVGQKRKLTVWRDGQELTLEATLRGMRAADFVSPPFVADQAPDYEVVGGLVFQELSRQFLKQWGQNWRTAAPQKLVYLDEFQGEVFGGE